MIATLAFAWVAGILSTLSPCVLPLLPVVLGTAASEHRYGPAALAGGVAISFTVLGLFVASVGAAIGLGSDVFRAVAAVLLVAIGAVLLVPRFQYGFAAAAAPVGQWTESRFGGFSAGGIRGQFLVGLLLGAVWSPCVGPTLGAASVAAARQENLAAVAVTMAGFGVGAALPLLLLGVLSRRSMLLWRERMRSAAGVLKPLLGAMLVAAGLFILTGWDKRAEAFLVEASPEWLTLLTTRF